VRRRAALLAAAAIGLAGCHRVGTLRGDRPAPPGAIVRVASYNVWGLPLEFAQETESRMARLPDALRSFDADVICLQEVWVPTHRAKIAEALAPAYQAAKSTLGGLMVLSRLPITEERFTPYPQPPDLSVVERLANKGVLEVTVETAAGPLRVLTTHMVAFNRKAREEGLPTLVKAIEASPERPLVLAGDLNIDRLTERQSTLSASYRRILETGCVDCDPPVRLEDGVFGEKPNTHIGWPRQKDDIGWWRPDHILVRSGEKTAVSVVSARMALDTPETALSDHNLMFAELRLTTRPPSEPAGSK
jgi:endonuclease/exonuclease/phosphatase family metal-dependent hydrolase